MPLVNGVWRPVLTFPITSLTAPANPIGRACLLVGYSFVESSGAGSCSFDLLDGNNASGTLISPITLDAGQSRQDEVSPDGVFCQSGPFVSVLTGTWRGALWIIDVTAKEFAAMQTQGG